ncbi:DNA adenine methylase [Ochrobactrum sp. EDr1-4]|uniref:DNA adenine methylase n=1 Tax=Ochrobactrum sp. EDr1-4 TaxID=3368622 RepID=UPI003B9E1DF6
MVPFLKWAGGKRWLFTSEFIASLPKFDRYVEPFLGGGAGFFALEPKSSLLSDVNPELINLYEVVRDYPDRIEELLAFHQSKHSKDHFYTVRKLVPDNKIACAARMLYLNRTCWNGLYRLNMKGEFNVPIGTKTSVLLPSDNFIRASDLLKEADLNICDFQATIDSSKEGDLLFVDPPYTVAHNMNGFVKYNEKIFTWDDQLRLRSSLAAAHSRGACVILSNANHASISELYANLGEHLEVSRHSVISGTSDARGRTTELLVRLQ